MIGGVPPHPGPDNFCHLCPFEGTFKEVAIHHIDNHKDSVLNFYKRVISADTGKIAKQAFDYKYIPRDIESQGYEFKVDDHQESIKIVKCNRTHDRSTQTGHSSQDQCVGRDHGDSDLQSELLDLLPDVCEFLAENDAIHSVRLIQYMRLLSTRSFPLTNISYQVFLDLVQWHSVSDHKQMRYNPKVMQFWSVCKILFHTQMLEFMRGNDLVFDEDSQKLINDSHRNFAVPLEVHYESKISDEIKPGMSIHIAHSLQVYVIDKLFKI